MSLTTTSRQVPHFFDSAEYQNQPEPGMVDSQHLRSRTMPTLIRNLQTRSEPDTPMSSDDESQRSTNRTRFVRGRNLDRDLENKLHEAVSSIRVTRSMSPCSSDATEQEHAQIPHLNIPPVVLSVPSPVSEGPARPTHVKSVSLNNISAMPLTIHASADDSSAVVLEPEEEHAALCRPHRMVRKKSGELVRSSLKTGLKGRRPASMPSTPAYTKNVHFDRKLEHVRHFLHSEKPAAVSANTSPTQEYSGFSEFPFNGSPRKTFDDNDLTIELPNFVPEAQQTDNEGAIIKVETVYLSTDKRSLIGRVAVRNLSFQKSVCVRYTLDDWRTTSETAAEYTADVRKKQREDAFDRFLFHIKIDDFVGVTDKTMFFCVRYSTAGTEYWDSNAGQNFRVEFHKKSSPEQKYGIPPLAAPVRRGSVDDIAIKLDDASLGQARQAMKSPRSLIFENIYDDHPATLTDEDQDKTIKIKSIGQKGPSNDSFSNRYDFGASLTAAIAAANSMLQGSGDEIKMKNKAQTEHVERAGRWNPYFSAKLSQTSPPDDAQPGTISPTFPPALDSSTCNTPASSGNSSPIPGLSTKSAEQTDKAQAYQSLLDNYCFFQPNKSRPRFTPRAELSQSLVSPADYQTYAMGRDSCRSGSVALCGT